MASPSLPFQAIVERQQDERSNPVDVPVVICGDQFQEETAVDVLGQCDQTVVIEVDGEEGNL